MAADDTPSSRIVVVGDPSGSFAREAARVAGPYGLGVSFCADVYQAATELARRPAGFLAVTGDFRELARGKGEFLALLERRGVPCCCLLDGTVEREAVLAAVRRGVRLAGSMADIREFLEDCLAAGSDRPPSVEPDSPAPDDYRATEAEIEALLRPDEDE
jgi:hypothetical protein